MLSESNLYTRSVLSNSVKREVLWNVVEPGDPYDIKKSMIARLPGDKRIAMGEHLDLVCLLQAAEIERLCEFLEDYKLKFREVERATLDRHSYEVQIKELTVEITQYEAYKADNNKLRDFIKKQGAEIQNLQKNYRDTRGIDDTFKIISEKSAEKITQLTLENQKLTALNQDYRVQVQNFNARLEAFERAKNKEIQDLKLNSAQYSKQTIENTLNIHRFQYEGETRRLEFELKKLKEAYDQKSNQAFSLIKANEEYARELALAKGKGENLFILEKNNKDCENRLSFATKELDRISIALREVNNKFEEGEQKRRFLENRIEKYEFEIKEYEGRLRMSGNEISHLNEVIKKLDSEARKAGESQQFILQYESKIKQISRQRDQLNAKVLQQVNGSQRLRQQLDKLSYQSRKYKLIERENAQLKEGIIERDVLKRRTVELENKIASLAQQLERSYGGSKNKDIELQRYRAVAFENEGLKAKIKEVESFLTSKYEGELARVRAEHENKLQFLTKTQGNQFQLKAQSYEREADRLKEFLKAKSEESEKQRARIYQLENYINRYQIQTVSKLKNYENSINQIRKQNEELYLKSRKLEEAERKLFDSQNKINQFEKECERLSALIKSREEEIFGLKGRLRETEGYTQKYELDVSRKITGYQQNINAIRLENEELRKKINEFVAQSNKKINESVQQINKLNTLIRNLNDEKIQLQFRLKQLSLQNENLKQNGQKLYKDNEQLRAKLMEVEVKHSNFYNEANYTSKRFTTQNETLKKQLNDYQVSISSYEAEVNKRFASYEQSLAALRKENEDLKRKIRELDVDVANLKQQLDISNKKFRAKSQEAANIDNNYKNLAIQLQNAKRLHQQYELSVRNRFEGEVNSNYANYEQTIQALRSENQTLRRKVGEGESKFAQLAQEHDKVLRTSAQQNEALRKQLAQRDNLATNFEADVKTRITNYQLNIQNLVRINQELQANLSTNINSLNKRGEELRQLDEKNRLLASQLEALQRNYSNLEVSFKNRMEGEVASRYSNYEDVISKTNADRNEAIKQLELLSRQNAEIVTRINQLLPENEALRKKIDNYETSIAAYEAEVNKRFISYEQNIDVLAKEREDLFKKLQQGGDTTRKLLLQSESKLRNATQELEKSSITFRQATERQNEELRRKSQDLNELQRKANDLEVRLSMSNQEVEKQNLALKAKQDEIKKSELKILNQAQQIEAFRKQCNELQLRFSQTYEFEVVKKYNAYEENIADLKRKLGQSEIRNTGITQQLDRLSSVLKSKADESSQVNSTIRSISSEYDDFKRRALENQNAMKRETQELKKKLGEYERFSKQGKDQTDRRIAEYENKSRVLGQQIERLNEMMRAKVSEIEVLRKNLRDYEQSFNHTMDAESRSRSIQEAKLAGFIKENEDLKKLLGEAEARLQSASQESERATILLRSKVEELARQETANRGLSNEIEQLKRNNQDLNTQSRTIAEYQLKMGMLVQENDKLQMALRAKTDALTNGEFRIRELSSQNEQWRRQINEFKLNWARTSEDISRKNSSFEQNMTAVTRERDELFRRVAEYESRIALLNQELERVSGSLRSRTEQWQRALSEIDSLRQQSQKKVQLSENEVSNWQSNFKAVSTEYEAAKKHLQEYELNIKRLYSEFERLQAIINDLKRERELIFEKNHALSEEITRLRAENQDLEEQAREVRLRLSDEAALQKRVSEQLALMVVLFAEVESLRRRVSEKEKEVEEVRRRSLSPNIL